MSRVTYPAWPNYLSVAIYAAMSAASDRDRAIFGIFGCGSSKNKAILPASKSGILAIVANGGAWSVAARRWVGGKSRTIAEPAVDHCWDRRQTPAWPQRPRQVPATERCNAVLSVQPFGTVSSSFREHRCSFTDHSRQSIGWQPTMAPNARPLMSADHSNSNRPLMPATEQHTVIRLTSS